VREKKTGVEHEQTNNKKMNEKEIYHEETIEMINLAVIVGLAVVGIEGLAGLSRGVLEYTALGFLALALVAWAIRRANRPE
jgi:hypothetical protein